MSYIEKEKAIENVSNIRIEVLNTRAVGKTLFLEAINLYHDTVLKTLRESPTADVVEVVRCKDCKYCEVINSRDLYGKCRMTDLEFKPFDIDTRKHYCSYGERKEENEG